MKGVVDEESWRPCLAPTRNTLRLGCCVSDPPHWRVGGFGGGLPLPRRPQRGTRPWGWCLRPSVLGCQQVGFVCAWLGGWSASQQPGTCTAMELQGAGVRTGSEPWPWGRRTAGKNSRRQSPSTLLRGPSRALATSTHCSSAAVAWVRGNNSGIACRRGREKVVQATSWPNSERKTRRFLHCPGEADGRRGGHTDLGCEATLAREQGPQQGAGAVPLLLEI